MSIPIFSRAKNKKGFTLAELLIVVVILMILFGIGAPNLVKAQRNARQLELDSKAETIYVSVQNRLASMKVTGLSSVYQYTGEEFDFNKKENGVGRIEGLPSDIELGVDNVEENSICYFTSSDFKQENSTSHIVMNEDVVDKELRNGNWVVEYNPTSAIVYSVFYSEKNVDVAEGYEKDYGTYDAKYRYRQARLDDGAYIGYFGGGSARSSTSKDRLLVNVDVKNEERLDLIITCNIPDSINGTDYPVIVLDMFDALGNKYTKYFSYNSISEAYRTQIESSKKINSKEEWISNKENYTSFNIDKQNKQIQIVYTLDSLESESTRFVNKFKPVLSGPSIIDGAGLKLSIKASAIVPGNNLIVTGYSNRVNTNALFADDSLDDTAIIKYARHLQNLDSMSGVNSNITKVIQASDITLNGSDIVNFKPIDNLNIINFNGSKNGTKYKISDIKIDTRISDAGLFRQASGYMTFKDITLVGINAKASGNNYAAGSLIGRVRNGNITIENVQSYLTPVLVDGLNNRHVWISGKYASGGLIGAIDNGGVSVTNSSAATVIGDYNYKIQDDDINVTSFDSSTVGGLIGRVTNGSVYLDKTYSDSYLVGTTVGGLIGNASSNGVNTQILNSYAAGYATYDTRAAGLVLGRATIKNSYTILDRLYMSNKNNTYYRVSMAGDNKDVFFVTDNIANNVQSEEKVLNKSDSQLLETLNGENTIFTDNIQYNVAYGLMNDVSKNYNYPSIINLQHRGDSRAEFASFVYYEKYSDGSYGFYTPGIKSSLKNDPNIEVIGDGYGLVSPSNETKTINVLIESNNVDYSKEFDVTSPYQAVTSDGIYYIYPLQTSIINKDFVSGNNDPYYFLKASISASGETYYYFFNPYFAKTVIEANADSNVEDIDFNQDGDLIAIRTPRHLYNLSKYYDAYATQTLVCTFNQERNINYSLYDWNNFVGTGNISSQKPIGANTTQFKAKYNGGFNHIYNVNFISDNELYVGMFGRVSKEAELKNIVLRAEFEEGSNDNYYIKRNAINANCHVYMGILAGVNNGTITNCSVDGYYLSGINGAIQAYENSNMYIGGLVGYNEGIIENSVADIPSIQLSSTYANVRIGGLVGGNGKTIKDSYAIGNLNVAFGKGGKIIVAGFSAENVGSISNSYCLSAISGSGDSTNIYGFTQSASGCSNCEYLYNGSYHFINNMYSYTAKQSGSAIKGKNYSAMSIKDKTDIRKASLSYLYGSKKTESDGYPFVAVLKDENGNYVHYGDWVVEEELGNSGFFYWEKETEGENNGYHLTMLGIQNTGSKFETFINSTLCNSHDDGGIIDEYGYGYFSNTKLSDVSISFTNIDKYQEAYNDSASAYLTEQIPGYNFVAYTTKDPFKASSKGLILNGDKNVTQGEAIVSVGSTNTTYKFKFTPFFANSMSLESVEYKNVRISDIEINDYKDHMNASTNYGALAGTNTNKFEIRSAAQLQYLNWNAVTKNTTEWFNNNAQSVTETWESFPYLGFVNGNNFKRPKAKYFFNQSHDLNAKGSLERLFTPIGSMAEMSSNTNANLVATYFNGTYNGNSYVIKNVEILSKSQCVGLFGITIGADIQNVVMYSDNNNHISTSIESSNTGDRNWYCMGGLAGISTTGTSNTGGSAVFRNCTVSGYKIDDIRNVPGFGGTNIGGFVGMTNVNISNCSSVNDIDINVNYSSSSRNIRVGGLVGNFRGSELSNCYSGGSIIATKKDNNQNTNVHMSGLVGGYFLRTGGNLGAIFGTLHNKPIISNVYTFTDLRGNITNDKVISISPVASRADLSNDHLFALENAYYVNLGNNIYKNESRGVDIDTNTVKGISYEELASPMMYDLLSNQFKPVTTKEEHTGASIDGKYSFGGSNTSLINKNYPFPTVLRQNDVIYGNEVNVHYGEWPITSPYWENGRDSLDIFTNLKELNSQEIPQGQEGNQYVSSKIFKLYTNGLDFGTITPESFNESGEDKIVQIIPGSLSTDENGNKYYPIEIIPLNTGVKTISFKGTSSDNTRFENISFTLEISANLYVKSNKDILNIPQGDTDTYEVKLQRIDTNGNKEDISLDGVWSIYSNPSEIVKLSIDDNTYDSLFDSLNDLDTVHVKRNTLGQTMITTDFTYSYNVKTKTSEGKYVDVLYDGRTVILNIDAQPSYIDVIQGDFIGLSNRDDFNIAYLLDDGEIHNGQNGTYSSAIPTLNVVDTSNFFFYISKEKSFTDFIFENGTEVNLYINDHQLVKEGDVYVYTDSKEDYEDKYYVSLGNESADSYYRYKPGSIYCVTTDNEYDLSNAKEIKLKAIIKNNTSTYVLTTDLDANVKREVTIKYLVEGNPEIKVLTGNYMPDTSKVSATDIPQYKVFTGWIKVVGENEESLEKGINDYITSDTTYKPVYDFIKPILYANGGEFSDFRSSVVVEMDENSNGQFDLSMYSPERERFNLIGWSKTDDGLKLFDINQQVTLNEIVGSDEYKLYALWKSKFTTINLQVDEDNGYTVEIEKGTNKIDYITYKENLNLPVSGWKINDLVLIELKQDGSLNLVKGISNYTDTDGRWIYDTDSLTLEPN